MEKPDKLKSALYKIVEAGEKYKENRYTGTIKYHLKIVYRQGGIRATQLIREEEIEDL